MRLETAVNTEFPLCSSLKYFRREKDSGEVELPKKSYGDLAQTLSLIPSTVLTAYIFSLIFDYYYYIGEK